MENMNANTKLEIAVEIMAAKIAKTSKEGYTVQDSKMKNLIDERDKMYLGDEEIINKIIEKYGPEIKIDYDNVGGNK